MTTINLGGTANDGSGDSLRVGGGKINDAIQALVNNSFPSGSITNAMLDDGAVTSAKLADGAVTNVKIADMAQATFKMRAAGAGDGVPIDGTAAQVATALGINLTLDADKPISTPMLSRLAQYETTVHRLCNESDPALITSTLIEAALAADAGVQVIQYLGENYAHDKVTVANRDISIQGKGSGATLIDFSGATGGFAFTDSSTSLTGGKAFEARGMSIITDDTTFRAFDARWSPRPFFFDGQLATFEDINGVTKDIASAQAWSEIIYCENAQGFSASRIDGSNRRDNESGKAIRLKTCLGGARVSDCNLNYFDDSIYCEPTAFSLLGLTGVTGVFEAGDVVTSSGGAVGMLMRDLGSSNIAVIPISGSMTATHTITGSLSGATATIGTVDNTRWWAGESLTVNGIEGVGVKRGVNVYNPNSVYQKFVGVFLDNIHANAKEYGINLEYASQVQGGNALLYALANNAIGYRLVGVDKWELRGRVENPSSYTGTVGIVISVGTAGYGTNTSTKGSLEGMKFDLVTTEVSLDPAATEITGSDGFRVDATDWVAWTPTVTAQTGSITTVGTVTARYRQMGKTLIGVVRVAITTAGTGANALQVTLPSGMTANVIMLGVAHANALTGNSGTVKIGTDSGSTMQAIQYNGTSFIADGADVFMQFVCELE